MKIYNDYLATIKNAMVADSRRNRIIDNYSTGQSYFEKGFSFTELRGQLPQATLLPSLDVFAKELQLKPNFNQNLGMHPDFAHLKESNDTENHYIISEFIDIKGSTNLFKRYSPETVLIITNTIQRAAIHTCLIFGGYIHRLQGDGLFVYFGGKSVSIETAVKNALISSSIFSYFVKNDLRNLFNEQGIENIYTRIGIDLGFDEDVLWASAGIGEISEVTTCSLHTSLASKMQAFAMSNGIVIGDNVIKQGVIFSELSTPVCHRTENERDRYIFQIPGENFRYTQYDFSWLKFLKKQPFIATDLDGNLVFKRKQSSNLQAKYIAPIAIKNKPYYE